MGLRNEIKEMADRCKELCKEPTVPIAIKVNLVTAEIHLLRAVIDLDFVLIQKGVKE